MNEVITELCSCCAQGGRGFNQMYPNVWAGCQCLVIRRCTDCSCCYEHCLCVSPEQRLASLGREDLLIRRSIDEARSLAATLGVDEIHGTMNEETMLEVEQMLKLRYKAFRRYTRRVYQLFQLQFDREMVERRLETDTITVEPDRPN